MRAGGLLPYPSPCAPPAIYYPHPPLSRAHTHAAAPPRAPMRGKEFAAGGEVVAGMNKSQIRDNQRCRLPSWCLDRRTGLLRRGSAHRLQRAAGGACTGRACEHSSGMAPSLPPARKYAAARGRAHIVKRFERCGWSDPSSLPRGAAVWPPPQHRTGPIGVPPSGPPARGWAAGTGLQRASDRAAAGPGPRMQPGHRGKQSYSARQRVA